MRGTTNSLRREDGREIVVPRAGEPMELHGYRGTLHYADEHWCAITLGSGETVWLSWLHGPDRPPR